MKPLHNFLVVVVGGLVSTVGGGWLFAWMTVNGYVPTQPTSLFSDAATWVYGTITPVNVSIVSVAIGWVVSSVFKDRLPAWKVAIEIERVNREAPKQPAQHPQFDLGKLQPEGPLKDDAASSSQLTSNGRIVLSLFAKHGVAAISMSKIALLLDWREAKVQSVVGFLHQTKFVQYAPGPSGRLVALTSKGEEFVSKLRVYI